MISAVVITLLCQQAPAPAPSPPAADAAKRVELNLLGTADTQAGESRRNENIQFNLVDNNALKELNVRLGVTATIVPFFRADQAAFGSEFGNAPVGNIHLAPSKESRRIHGELRWSHLNSVTSARTFFQVGGVKPAHENDYGITAGGFWRKLYWQSDVSQQRLRGNVNGNVLVPTPEERTPLAADPALRALIARWLAAYPRELPNRTDINARALNTNSAQRINNDNASGRVDSPETRFGRLLGQYSFTRQQVDAFQLVAGQNPDTLTRSQRARLTWVKTVSPNTIVEASFGFDRIRSILTPEPNAVGPMVSIAGLETLGPQGSIPIDRAQNLYRTQTQLRRNQNRHTWSAGATLLRRQFNGLETDAHRGFFAFANDFDRDSVTNFRMGRATQYILSIGDTHRGFRNWEIATYAGDTWKISDRTTFTYGVRYSALPAPREVNGLNPIPYDCDCNNVAPLLGLAQRLPRKLGVFRAAASVQFGEIFPVTFQQVRFSPPGSVKVVAPAPPDLTRPLVDLTQAKPNLYLLDPELATPYSYQYSASWEPDWRSAWRVQLGYTGSRSHKLLNMWYLNRAQPTPGIPQTTATFNQRRADPRYAEIRYVVNASNGYYDAARVTLIVPRWRGVSLDSSYWFSKGIDLGSAYTNTAYDNDSRLGRGQSEFEMHRDMRGLSPFDQPHAFLTRLGYTRKQWTFSTVGLLKSGTPFTVAAGADGPGFGNVDANGGDRPNIIDPSILGRKIGHPDSSRQLLPRTAFSFMRPTDPRGNLGRNTFRKGGIRNVNASLARTFALRGSAILRLRAESINLLNSPQFAEPGFELANPNFGQITNTLNEGRTFRWQVQFGW